jgi:hypothetical protein
MEISSRSAQLSPNNSPGHKKILRNKNEQQKKISLEISSVSDLELIARLCGHFSSGPPYSYGLLPVFRIARFGSEQWNVTTTPSKRQRSTVTKECQMPMRWSVGFVGFVGFVGTNFLVWFDMVGK